MRPHSAATNTRKAHSTAQRHTQPLQVRQVVEKALGYSPLHVDKGMRAKGPQWHVQCQWHRGSTVRPLHTVAAACASGKIGLWARAG